MSYTNSEKTPADTGQNNLGVFDSKIRVLIVDDHALMRQMLSDVLALDEGIEVVARAADGQEALQLVEEVQPDVIVLDFAMPGANGIDVMQAIREQRSLPVLMVSVHTQPSLVQRARHVGVQGYLPKLSVARSLAPAVRAVSEGRPYFGENNQWSRQA
jgi:DNA-binding NarL/FixJ family response regulator